MSTYNEKQRHELEGAIEDKIVFFFVSVGVIVITLGLLTLIDFLPEKPESNDVVEETSAVTNATESYVETTDDTTYEEVDVDHPLPVSIYIDALEREVNVLNPVSGDVETLDNALLSGVVRHPDSADFGTIGTIFLLGHSSYLPNVINGNFQAFNGIQKLEWGDTIRLRTESMEYIYSVDRVYEAKASSAEVPLQFEEHKLVLATCNTFATKDDRYVVEATLVAKKALTSSI